jgi:hypothetical protein
VPELEQDSSIVTGDYVEPTGREPGVGGRRRAAATAAAAVVAVLAVMVAALSLTGRDDDGASVQSGAGSDLASALPAPAAPMIELEPAPGWQTLRADGELLAVSTAALTERDLVLALLARDDAVFADFPSDGAVLVVGGDRFVAKSPGDLSSVTRTVTESGVEIVELPSGPPGGPLPPAVLGRSTTLAGNVTVRRADLPRSVRTIAAYFGPDAPDSATQEAEAMVATIRLPPPDPGVMPPPPPPGSRPGSDGGGVELSDERISALSVDGYEVEADAECAVVSTVSGQPIAGGCEPLPAGGGVAAPAAASGGYGPPALPPPGQSFGPGAAPPTPAALLVLVRVGPDVRRVTALLVDGGTAGATIGHHGWALVATDGRPFLLEGRDGEGRLVGHAAVT